MNPVRNPVSQSRRIVLSLCDGIGGAAKALQAAFPEGTGIDAYIAVEKNRRTRDIAQIINPKADGFPGITHGLNGKHDIFKITEDDIKSLGENNIELHAHSPQCNDHSKFRLLPDRPGYRGPKRTSADPRPGLDGKSAVPTGAVFRTSQVIAQYQPPRLASIPHIARIPARVPRGALSKQVPRPVAFEFRFWGCGGPWPGTKLVM